MTSKHTPGPWEAVLRADPRGQPVCYYRGLIALVESRLSVVLGPGHIYDTVPEDQWEANATLIAAAPLLADVLQEAVADYDADKANPDVEFVRDEVDLITRARAALRLAGRLP